MALRMSSPIMAGLMISPLRTARDFAWPRPMMLSAPFSLHCPTTAHTLEVPSSSPTIIGEGSNMLFFVARKIQAGRGADRSRDVLLPAGGNIVRYGQVEWRDGFGCVERVVMKDAPALQLAVKTLVPYRDSRALAGCDNQDLRRGDVDFVELNARRHRRLAKFDDQTKGCLNPCGTHRPASSHFM